MAKRILIIDDDEGILEGFQAMLESEGYDVMTSPDAECLESLSKENFPDLILLDVLLSGLDGRDVCKRLKNNSETKRIPVVMMSAAPGVEQSVLACADGFLKKPFEMDEVLAIAKKY